MIKYKVIQAMTRQEDNALVWIDVNEDRFDFFQDASRQMDQLSAMNPECIYAIEKEDTNG